MSASLGSLHACRQDMSSTRSQCLSSIFKIENGKLGFATSYYPKIIKSDEFAAARFALADDINQVATADPSFSINLSSHAVRESILAFIEGQSVF